MGRDEAPVRNFEFLIPFQDRYLQLSEETYYRKTSENDSIMIYSPKLVNSDQLINDQTFLLKLHDAIMIRIFKIRGYQRTIKETRRMIKEIENEINYLESS